MVKELFWPLKVVWLAAVAMVSPLNWAMTVALDIIAYFVDRPYTLPLARELLCHVVLMCAAKALKCAYLQPWLAERGLTTAASRVSTSTFWGASALAGRALWELYWVMDHISLRPSYLLLMLSYTPMPFSRPQALW
jgi:hypothetical protein